LIIPDEIHDLLRWSDWVRTYRATAEFFDRRLAASAPRIQQSRKRGRAKELPQLSGSKFKDFLNIAAYKKPVDHRTTEHGVAHEVRAECALAALFEVMFVNPCAVRSATLLVNEARWRFPCRDFRAPFQGKAMHAQFVIDERPRMHLYWWRRENTKS